MELFSENSSRFLAVRYLAGQKLLKSVPFCKDCWSENSLIFRQVGYHTLSWHRVTKRFTLICSSLKSFCFHQQVVRLVYTAWNTVISPNFLVWKFVKMNSFRRVSGNSTSHGTIVRTESFRKPSVWHVLKRLCTRQNASLTCVRKY